METMSKESLVQLITAQVLAKISQSVKVEPVATGVKCLQPEATLIKGIVTARKLEGLSVVAIDPGSIVTPSARDYIKEKKIQVQAAFVTDVVANQPSCNSYHFWSVCSDFTNTCNTICNELNIINIPNKHRPDEIEFVLGEIHTAIEKKSTKGGILVVDTSPIALFATRNFTALRPIVGNYPKTIEDGVNQIGANLLILEKQYLGKTAMQDLAKLFVSMKKSDLPYSKQVKVGGCS